jgi:predicted nuclease of predicted toxin-antitoxin system
VRILLDENFPLALYRRLRADGAEAEHIIASGQRGIPDGAIRHRLEREELLFLTQDEEFMDQPAGSCATIVVSRVSQSRPILERVEVWLHAIHELLEERPAQKIFELLDSGELRPARPLEGE